MTEPFAPLGRPVLTALALLLAIAASPRRAAAEESTPTPQACSAAYDGGQALRREHKLIEAREQFRTCAQRGCPAPSRADCGPWYEQADAAVPSIVFRAVRGARDIIDVRVSIDGRPTVPRLDGRAVELDSGPHTATFETADGAKADVVFRADEGFKLKPVIADFDRTSEPPPPPPPPPATPWRTISYVILSAGAAGLVIGGAFGGLALGSKNSAHCDGTGLCTGANAPSDIRSARSQASVSTIAFVAGGGLALAGLTLLLFGPASGSGHASASIHAVPLAGGGGAVLWEGVW